MRHFILLGVTALAATLTAFALFSETLARGASFSQEKTVVETSYNYPVRVGEIHTPVYPENLKAVKARLAEKEATLGPNHIELASALDALGAVASQSTGIGFIFRLGYAERGYRRALAIREQALPPNAPELEASWRNLGTLYNDYHRPASARSCFERVLEIQSARHDGAHPDMVDTLEALAEIHLRCDNEADAESYYHRILDMAETEHGLPHRKTLDTLQALARLYGRMERYDDEEAIYWRMAELGEMTRGVQGVAHVLERQGRDQEARKMLEELLAARRDEEVAPEHLIRFKQELAGIAEQAGKVDEAIALYEQVVELATRNQLEIVVISTVQRLTRLYALQEREADIEALRGEIREVTDAADMDEKRREALDGIIDMLFEPGRHEVNTQRETTAP